ncbi:hypothetical protein B0F90DRAFT_74559 [Multifurca ochricompacta]|uniref:Uncharacterized protein n=1 Tax=Multifurca ochricompacta TaxID=376703 RepID=A0AAD4QTW9_9AGAM|nr:hypothetical protein B0F90DRAFT_74559 [Multifurca ochricompacta]
MARMISDQSPLLPTPMTSFVDTALSVLNSPPITHPRRFLKSLPDIVRRILPHARYSSFLETLVAGSHLCNVSARKTPSLPIQDVVASTKDSRGSETSTSSCLGTNIVSPSRKLEGSAPRSDDVVFRILYKAHGKFAWMNGRRIENVRVLKWLGEGIMSSAYIKSGQVERRHGDGCESVGVRLNYICKTWDMSKMKQWEGFYSEVNQRMGFWFYILKRIQPVVVVVCSWRYTNRHDTLWTFKEMSYHGSSVYTHVLGRLISRWSCHIPFSG